MDAEMGAGMPLAIVGMSCRFPGGSNSPELLWDFLKNGKSGWTQDAGNRFHLNAFYHPAAELGGVFNAKGFHLLTQDLAGFDARFFNISPAEAKSIDPQQRLLLETAYEAFENAGVPLERLAGSNTGVYVAGFNSDYERMLSRDPENVPSYRATGTGIAIMSNRISYAFDLKGPSLTLDTGCSGSLVALHQACHSIRSGEIDQALVGGTNLILDPELTNSLSMLKLLGDTGRCFTFDERAQGYGRGEGVAAVIVKRLSKALDDGDCIRAVIRNTVVNQDGKTQGITMPSGSAQKSMMRKAYAEVGLDPGETSYVEAHGTGTEVGDAIEAEAIASIFTESRGTGHPVIVGSIKTNIGHTESTAGLAGLIKAVLMLEKGVIVPNYDFQQMSHRLSINDQQLEVPRSVLEWPNPGLRRASVNSFGYGGTNAHVVLDATDSYLPKNRIIGLQYHSLLPKGTIQGDPQWNGNDFRISNGCDAEKVSATINPQRRLIVFSGNSEESLQSAVENFKTYAASYADNHEVLLDDLTYTICCRRTLLPFRLHRTAATVIELLESLDESKLKEDISKSYKASDRPKICFVFNGQGAQWAGMARELFGSYPAFELSIKKAEDRFRELGADWTLREELLKPEKLSNVNQASLSQALCTAIQIGLVDLFQSWNIRPDAVVGHSSGEIAAAYSAGALSFDDAITAIYYRGYLMRRVDQSLQGAKGAMLAVGLPSDQAIQYMKTISDGNGEICIACINSPSSITISGDRPQILALQKVLEAQRVFNRLLVVDKAYHSHHMGTIYDPYVQALARISPRSFHPSVCMISTVLGDDVDGRDLDATYWARNMVSPVRFSEALGKFCIEQAANHAELNLTKGVILEIGPHSSLAGPIKQIQKASGTNMTYASALVRNINASDTVLEVAGRLCTEGVAVSLPEVNMLENPRLLSDYPPYAWDCSKHWHESRLSKQYLQRKNPRHSVLGVLSPDNNPLEPKWRNYVKVSDIPWVTGHAFQGRVVYPASGFICMALEAVRQQARLRGESDKNVLYILRDINITRALLVPDDTQGVETVFSLRPYPQAARNSSAVWNEFRVFSVSGNGDWGEHCRGLISIQPHVSADEVEGNRENELLGNTSSERFAVARHDCQASLSPSKLYDHLESVSTSYTGLFRGLTSISTAPFESLTTFEIPSVQQMMPGAFDQPHLVHPVTLDLCFQAVMPALFSVGMMNAPTVLNYVEELTIVSEIDSTPGTDFVSHMCAGKLATHKYRGDIHVRQGDEHNPLLNIIGKGLVYTSLPTVNNGGGDAFGQDRKLCHRLEWVPDITCIKQQDVQSVCSDVLSNESGLGVLSRFDDRARHIIMTTLNSLSAEDEERMLPHQKLQLRWMRNNAPKDSQHSSSQPVDHLGADGEMLERIGSHLVDILKGKTHPLAIMMEGDLLSRCYNNKGVSRCLAQASEYVKMLCWKNPAMKVLEIGAGTGSATIPILKASSTVEGHLGTPLLDRYTFTDISAGFFEKARDLLEPWIGVLDFQKFDIEQSVHEQGFEDGSYDLIIACNVLHATSIISNTLSNVRRLLKPKGKLCLIEVTKPSIIYGGLGFGTLPGWWLGAAQDGRIDSPLLNVDEWNAALSANGFSGLDVWMPDHALDEDQQYSAIISTAVVEGDRCELPGIELLFSEHQTNSERPPEEYLFSHELANSLATLAKPSDTKKVILSDTKPEGKVVIVTLELVRPFLASSDEAGFEHIKQIFSTAKVIVWLTHGGTMDCANPLNALITGLSRSARSENRLTKLVTVDIDQLQECPETVAALLLKLVRGTLDAQADAFHVESEYAVKHGRVFVPRLVEDEDLNQCADADKGDRVARQEHFFQDGRTLALRVGTPGLLETMAWADEGHNQLLAHDEVRIEMRFGAINFRDLMVALGQLEGFPRIADESSGIVLEVGASAKNSFQVGDRVCAVGGGAYASSSIVKMHNACTIPDTMSLEVGASIPIAYTTAYYSLHTVANLQKGESVLIHSAAGGLGQAAVMVAQHIGAVIYVTVGSAKKKQFLMMNFDLPEEHIFSSRLTQFSRGIKRLTNGKGVDVILNSLAAETVRESCACIGKFGRFIEVGKRDAYVNARLDMEVFGRHVMFAAVDLGLIYAEKPLLFKHLLETVVGLVARGDVGTIRPLEVMPLEKIEDAYRYMQTGKHMGKILLKADSNTKVKVAPSAPPPAAFRKDGWYVVAGGLGGLGQAIIHWMADLGARNIIALSRSGRSNVKSVKFADSIARAGINLHIESIDVTDAAQVRSILELTGGKPISGIIQGAMVLNDSTMDTMSYKQWRDALGPKVQGTLNLYNELGDSLDFFIMLSSATGLIGSFGQCNYAAGNTFQDAFARSMSSQGHPVRSLDLGGIADAGYVADHADSVDFLERQGLRLITFEKLIVLLNHVVNQPFSTKSSDSQLSLGLGVDESLDSVRRSDGKFSHIYARQHLKAGPQTEKATVDITKALKESRSPQQALEIVSESVINKLSQLLAIEVDNLSPTGSISAYGADSLVAVELRNWLAVYLHTQVQTLELLGTASIRELSETIVSRSELVPSFSVA